jgi:hypothetical protein
MRIAGGLRSGAGAEPVALTIVNEQLKRRAGTRKQQADKEKADKRFLVMSVPSAEWILLANC